MLASAGPNRALATGPTGQTERRQLLQQGPSKHLRAPHRAAARSGRRQKVTAGAARARTAPGRHAVPGAARTAGSCPLAAGAARARSGWFNETMSASNARRLPATGCWGWLAWRSGAAGASSGSSTLLARGWRRADRRSRNAMGPHSRDSSPPRAIGVSRGQYERSPAGLYTRAAFERAGYAARSRTAKGTLGRRGCAVQSIWDQCTSSTRKSGMPTWAIPCSPSWAELLRSACRRAFGSRISGDSRRGAGGPRNKGGVKDREGVSRKRLRHGAPKGGLAWTDVRVPLTVSISRRVALLRLRRRTSWRNVWRRAEDALPRRQGTPPVVTASRCTSRADVSNRAPLRGHVDRGASSRRRSNGGRLHLYAQLILAFAAADKRPGAL